MVGEALYFAIFRRFGKALPLPEFGTDPPVGATIAPFGP
jgi:hypothetical protein